jgi:hypothetical protein
MQVSGRAQPHVVLSSPRYSGDLPGRVLRAGTTQLYTTVAKPTNSISTKELLTGGLWPCKDGKSSERLIGEHLLSISDADWAKFCEPITGFCARSSVPLDGF